MTLSPKSNALAYRIWAHCKPLGWNADNAEIAAAIGESEHRTRSVIHRMGWTNRLRGHDRYNTMSGHRTAYDGPATIQRGDLDVRFGVEAAE